MNRSTLIPFLIALVAGFAFAQSPVLIKGTNTDNPNGTINNIATDSQGRLKVVLTTDGGTQAQTPPPAQGRANGTQCGTLGGSPTTIFFAQHATANYTVYNNSGTRVVFSPGASPTCPSTDGGSPSYTGFALEDGQSYTSDVGLAGVGVVSCISCRPDGGTSGSVQVYTHSY